MPRFFIERPIFAIVIAILIALIGALSITRLPVTAEAQTLVQLALRRSDRAGFRG